MFGLQDNATVDVGGDYYSLQDYQGAVPRWCPGCGDNTILSSVQKLLRDEQLPPEKTVFVSGIGCSSRFPHHMGTYGFHSLHGRALPIAQGVKIRRPDLKVFVNTGDGDCCSIGTAHWIHAIRYNFDMVVMVHDNEVYGMTKMQASPTTPKGTRTNTTPKGAFLDPLNILSATLGVSNVSFVANVVEWIPEVMYQVLREAYHHKGFSFVRIVQRCPHFLPAMFDPLLQDPNKILLLTDERGLKPSDDLRKVYRNEQAHDPSDLDAARRIVQVQDPMPVGVLYRNEDVPVYDEIRRPARVVTHEIRRQALDRELDRFAVDLA
jgi:2-oxoglutarate ferredoxin oxidoreductase subunit beta